MLPAILCISHDITASVGCALQQAPSGSLRHREPQCLKSLKLLNLEGNPLVVLPQKIAELDTEDVKHFMVERLHVKVPSKGNVQRIHKIST
ncbi:hypothetical protein SUGI_0266380 [Cryptomeria japonica]|nr:hypothetical protein SUGI_0266380 [Cryptomeria japonica]